MQENKHPSLPTPSYIPAGFNLRSVLWNPRDGFGGDDNERAMIYFKGGPDRVTYRNLPLQVIVSSDLEHEFAYTEKADSIHELIHMDDGTTVKGNISTVSGSQNETERAIGIRMNFTRWFLTTVISMWGFERQGKKSALKNYFESLVLSLISS